MLGARRRRGAAVRLAACQRSDASFAVYKARHQPRATGFITSVKGGWIDCRLGPRKALRCQATASGGNEPLVQVAQLPDCCSSPAPGAEHVQPPEKTTWLQMRVGQCPWTSARA